ncbi:S24 family peptidase [Paenochrobactrum pullorum]|uniref:S24 family peptidase n=1 Tax=Paenochrobactrum pullorum TaxID=1324351 RepID=UPI0035BC4BAE
MDLLSFKESWLRGININPRYARVLIAKGDSMEPTIRDGDVLLVDTSITSVYDSAIYIVVYNGHTLVKRVNMLRNGSLMIISDNNHHPPEDVPLAEVPNLRQAQPPHLHHPRTDLRKSRLRQLYLDEIEKRARCKGRGCHGHMRMAMAWLIKLSGFATSKKMKVIKRAITSKGRDFI